MGTSSICIRCLPKRSSACLRCGRVGLNATDTLILLPRFPAYGGKVPFEREVLSPADKSRARWSPAPGWVCAQNMSARSVMTSAAPSNSIVFGVAGVNLDDIEIRPNCPNQSAYILVDQTSGERTVLWHRDACLRIDPDTLTPKRLPVAACCTSTGTTHPPFPVQPKSRAGIKFL